MYTLKSIVQRGTLFGASAALLVAAVAPAVSVFADSLNPLTERSLLLTSSAPGYVDTDGSGNSAAMPNSINENYAPAGSGPNGKKSGETFTFKMSSATADVKGFSLQYCTSAAGFCQAPGNNDEANPTYTDGSKDSAGDFRNGGDYVTGTNETGRPDNAMAHPLGKSDFDVVGAWTEGNGAGQYEIRTSTNNGTSWTPLTGWAITAANLEDDDHTGTLTGKMNYLTLTNATGETLTGGTMVEIRFRPSETVYITNPGSKEFFVKINTYSSDTNMIGSHNDGTPTDPSDSANHTVIDGGVTVANVMTDSIHITTKVLETMSFSVGTENPDTVELPGVGNHGSCDAINTPNGNRLSLGNPNAEYSLETGKAWDVYSYWRLSSNSSGGAAVYYSGDTLRNTVGDQIADMSTGEVVSTPGTEQFGLGFVDAGLDTLANTGDDIFSPKHVTPRSYPFITMASQTGTGDYTGLASQNAADNYDEATGTINGALPGDPGDAKFFFKATSLTIPELIAQQNEMVISCATAKMRYVGNIAADTPAGVYTTKINYLAAPQY